MEGYLQALLGIAVSVGLFVIGYRQTVGGLVTISNCE
jgi:hypothetical protein